MKDYTMNKKISRLLLIIIFLAIVTGLVLIKYITYKADNNNYIKLNKDYYIYDHIESFYFKD